ncbi:DUF1254 domain-containing protein [Pseudomonas sp. MDT2-39-1]|uniref:DUF1254 domain-containing protein n=1 Tax=Pseudomonas sp. BGI-2 TaxID=2528211 RepID=UPI001035251F|nr:DUF1254 domain-containing protein [Pseudomonas sp. BGI-2]TBN49075.1 DUF1254 domain-containing protein [Pseudomonas sp. BGI-2]
MLIPQALTVVALTLAVTVVLPLDSQAQSKVISQEANAFVTVPQYPSEDFKAVVQSNVDTLYSIAWLDLTKEPQVITAPDTAGRLYVLPMLDMWSDVFASPGGYATGTQSSEFVVTPPGWTGTVPAGLNHLPAPTPFVWVVGRTDVSGAVDYAMVNRIQAGYTVTPLSQIDKRTEQVDPEIAIRARVVTAGR